MDYFLTTIDQLEGVKCLEVNCDEKYSGHKDVHSDHRPLVLTITQQWQPPPVQQKAIKHLPRFKYDTTKAAEFSRSVQHNISVWASPDVLDASNVQTTINLLQQCITQFAEVFGNRQVALVKAIKHNHKPWFDIECRHTKSQFAKLSHAHPDRQVRLKQMKQLYKRKKCAYDVLKAKQLCGLAKADPASFWKRYRKHTEGVNGITNEALRDGFQQLLQPPVALATTGVMTGAGIQAHVVSFPPNGIDCEQLNVDITPIEVQQAFRKLK